MSGHRHNPTAATQNQGNSLGDRACVRQSKLYRVHESGNNVKSLLGTSHLCWDQNQTQGAYEGRNVYDHTEDDPLRVNYSHAAAQENPKYGRTRPREAASGTGNFYSGYGAEDGAADYRRAPAAAPRQSQGAYETTASGYGRENNDRIGKYGQMDSYEPRGDYGRGGADYQRRASYDREPAAYDSRSRARGASYNDENANSMKNALSHYNAGDEMSGGGKGDRGYRSLRDQLDNRSDSYQRPRQEPVADDNQRSAIRTYKGQDRDTRPW